MQIKNKVVTVLAITLLITGLLHITMNIVPVAFSEPGETRKEFWQVINVTNTVPYDNIVDINITVNSREGVYIAASTGVTAYFNGSWPGYTTYMDWLNGTSSLPHHWGEMDWIVSNGSLTSITYDEIQHWGGMYFDSGGGVSYTTFMGNTYMADWNLTNPYNDPDIISQAYWKGNEIKIIDDMIVPNGTTMYVVFKIVITKPGYYAFNVVTTPGVTVAPSSWKAGGVATLLVGKGPEYQYHTIQEAVNAATSGDTIIVTNGTYNENVVIPKGKSLTLLGAQANVDPRGGRTGPETILDGGGYSPGNYGFTIHDTEGKDVITINGFTIRNYEYGIYGRYSDTFIQNLTVSYNIFENNGDPALPSGSDWHHNGGAIRISNVDQSKFSYNVIRNCERGIRLDYNSNGSDYNIVEHNLIHDLQQYAIGLYDYANNNIVRNNTIYNCADRGIQLWKANTGNKFLNNTIYNCCNDGILLHDSVNAEIKYNNVFNCAFTNQTWSGDYTDNGGPASGFGYQPVHAGITILGASFNITIAENNVHDNGELGSGWPEWNGRTSNAASDGIWIDTASSAVIYYNNIYKNNEYGVENTNISITIQSTFNWWGNETGPKHSTNPYGGYGDNVSDNVLFGPWLIKPYPPLSPISVVYVNPLSVVLETPALGTQFTVNVTIANVTMLYAFQFTLKWNSSLLTLMNPTNAHKIPTVWGTNYISQYNYSLTGGNYTLFASARSPAPTFNGTTTVASLTFKSTYEPLYPQNATCSLSLENVIISDPNATQILRLVYSGNYTCNSAKPKLLFESKEYTAKQVPTEFDAYINVTNVVNLTAYYFKLTFNSTLLKVPNATYVEILLHGTSEIRSYGSDYVVFNVTGISPVNGSARLARVRFMANGTVWNIQTRNVSCSLAFVEHELGGTAGIIDHEAIDGKYIYKPVPGDLDMNGVVDIIDLSAAAKAFGVDSTDPRWSMYSFADLNLDNVINVLDIVMVARNFNRTEPEP